MRPARIETTPSRISSHQFRSAPRVRIPVHTLVTPSISAHAPNSATRIARPQSGARKASTPNAIASTPRRMKVHHQRASATVCETVNAIARSGRAVGVGMRGGDGLEQALRRGGHLGHGLVEGVLVGG